MPAPPAYHMVVDSNAPLPTISSPYEPHIEEEEKDEDDTPEITINAATQIRGNGNIISIAQMDSARIANLIACMLHGGKGTEVESPTQTHPQSPPTTPTAPAAPVAHETTKKQFSTLNITVNCGATIIGDRNIVGPGLGDIARQMQLAQRNQVLHAQQQAQQQQQQQQQQAQHHHHPQQQQQQQQSPLSPPDVKESALAQRRETLYQAQAAIAQHHGTMYAAQGLMSLHAPTPPMSRSSSFGDGAGGVKRKAEGDTGETCCKKQC
ncbi:uncharacterized protein K460DRAFT_410421 [Cucurbitaria berberidis CBS 394.84]|uniref:Uncharacterized protein n=1 Tax=Cucurbitaria berberidis CBS 394.84 TaxID=1168544 RepID=A0A9P4G984_9PLEO|nr:uncharacterized protein K460DRAFT_410421 [Cucurbitaria berberidis CBS 394.84]KAF1841029.1 hypothetical protein K460DRAFT_410421 [Cucurbitaria berberidis CBS 394.84]